MKFESVNIFPTSIYVGEIENHSEYKKIFYDKIYKKFEYEQIDPKTKTIHTTSENQARGLCLLGLGRLSLSFCVDVLKVVGFLT